MWFRASFFSFSLLCAGTEKSSKRERVFSRYIVLSFFSLSLILLVVILSLLSSLLLPDGRAYTPKKMRQSYLSLFRGEFFSFLFFFFKTHTCKCVLYELSLILSPCAVVEEKCALNPRTHSKVLP